MASSSLLPPPSAALKAAGAALLSAESLAGALLPVLLARHPGPLALVSCFGGGVFLAAALLHLLPHCAEQAEALAREGPSHHHHHYHHPDLHDPHDHHHHHHHRVPPGGDGGASSSPPPYLALVLLGYLLVLAAERVLFEHAHDHHGHGHHGHHHHHHHEHHGHAAKEEEEEEKEDAPATRGRSRGRATTATATTTATPAPGTTTTRSRRGKASTPARSPSRARSASRGRRQSTPAATTKTTPRRKKTNNPQNPQPQSGGLTAAGLRSCLVAVLATSVHTLLECAALGLASDRRGFFALLAAVAAHKPASALALSSRFLRSGATPRQAAAYTSLFALVAPAGVAAGALAVGVGAEAELWLSCLSAGAFLYVGLTEVIAEELDGQGGWRSRWAKFAALLAGVVSVAAIGGHEH